MLKNDQTLQDFHFLYRIMYHMLGNFSAPCMKGLIVWIILLQNLFTLFFILTQTSVLINLANSKIIWLSNERERSMSFQWQSTLKFPKTSLKSRKLLFLNKKMIPSELSVLHKKCPYSELFWSAFVPHFRHSDWIRRATVFSPNAGKCGTEKLQIRTLFTQCCLQCFYLITNYFFETNPRSKVALKKWL